MNVYDDPLYAELYDQVVTDEDDVALVAQLVARAFDGRPVRVLEAFCGTGRMSVPLAQLGHHVVGRDGSEAMLNRAHRRAAACPRDVRARLDLARADALEVPWEEGFDVTILAASALHDLPSRKAQETCLSQASRCLASGGHVFIDNPRVTLEDYWVGFRKDRSVYGVGEGGVYGEAGGTVVAIDEADRRLEYRRYWLRRPPGGEETRVEFPWWRRLVYPEETEEWLGRYGFSRVAGLGSRAGDPPGPGSPRAIFWARKD
jgi:SAM-dependent methyltransferase